MVWVAVIMVVVLLVLLNLSTLVLLNALEDSVQSWRLAQHDIQVARAERAVHSALAFSVAQLQQGMQVPATLAIGASWQAQISTQQQPCSNQETTVRECVVLQVEVAPLRELGPLQQISRVATLELPWPSGRE
jgi:hypothetical protein